MNKKVEFVPLRRIRPQKADETLKGCVAIDYPFRRFAAVLSQRDKRYLVGAAVALIVFALTQLEAVAAVSRPDILIIMPDQMRGDCMSAVHHPVVRTPTLDKLARGGTLFRHAYSTCPSCIPARFSLLTGLYPSSSGVVGFKGKPIKYPTLPQMLGDAGYQTALTGRNMHQVPANEPYGYQKVILGSEYVSDDDYDHFLQKAAPESGGIRKLMNDLGVTANGWEAKPWPLAENLHPTAWVVGQARKVIKEASTDKPLFLTASFFSPHPPLFPPKKYFDYYYNKKLPAPAHGDWVDWSALSTKGDKQGHRVLLEGEALRATLSGYFGLIEFLDDQIAPLIADFKKRSEQSKRPWIIVFTTDHGECLGDNGYYRKCEPYEGSANIPFIIAGSPDLRLEKNVKSEELVCLEDVMPTLLSVAGVSTPKPMDGIDLTTVMRREKKGIRPYLHFEHAECYSKPQEFQALTDGHFKYIWRPLDGSDQLFDLRKDPHEERDLSKIAGHQEELKTWRELMVKQLNGRPEGFVDDGKLVAGRPYPPLQKRE